MIEADIRVGRGALKNEVMIGIDATAFVALFAFSAPFPIDVLIAGLVGYFGAAPPRRDSNRS